MVFGPFTELPRERPLFTIGWWMVVNTIYCCTMYSISYKQILVRISSKVIGFIYPLTLINICMSRLSSSSVGGPTNYSIPPIHSDYYPFERPNYQKVLRTVQNLFAWIKYCLPKNKNVIELRNCKDVSARKCRRTLCFCVCCHRISAFRSHPLLLLLLLMLVGGEQKF